MHPDDERYGWRVLGVTAIGILLCFVNASTLNVTLPVVASDLGASPAQASWILLSYMLVTSIFILSFGRLGDMLGRRRLYLFGLATLTLASVGCALASNITLFLLLRVVQALGAAAVITNTSSLVSDAFPLKRLGLGLGIISTISACAQGLGPVIGSAIVSLEGWRAIFWLNLPVGCLGLFFARRILRAQPAHGDGSFDFIGCLLSLTGVGGLIMAMSMGGPEGWGSPEVRWAALVGVITGALFIWRQRTYRHPLMDLRLFQDRVRSAYYLCITLIALAQTSSVLLIALFIQAVQGLSVLDAGLRTVPVALGMTLAAPISGRLIGQFQARSLLMTGLALAALGAALIALLLSPTLPYPLMGGCLLMMGIGIGTFIPPNNTGIMQSVTAGQRGVANGIRSTLMNIGFVLGTATTLTIATAGLTLQGQAAAYAGHAGDFSPADLRDFVLGCRAAFAVLSGCCLLGMAVVQVWVRRTDTQIVEV